MTSIFKLVLHYYTNLGRADEQAAAKAEAELQQQRQAATRIQATVRSRSAHAQLAGQRAAAVRIQTMRRGQQARQGMLRRVAAEIEALSAAEAAHGPQRLSVPASAQAAKDERTRGDLFKNTRQEAQRLCTTS